MYANRGAGAGILVQFRASRGKAVPWGYAATDYLWCIALK